MFSFRKLRSTVTGNTNCNAVNFPKAFSRELHSSLVSGVAFLFKCFNLVLRDSVARNTLSDTLSLIYNALFIIFLSRTRYRHVTAIYQGRLSKPERQHNMKRIKSEIL